MYPGPDRDLARTILAFAYLTLEVSVFQQVVLDMDGEIVASGILGHDAGQGLPDQDSVALETKVPVQTSRVVLLHDEAEPILGSPGRRAWLV